MNSQVNQFQKLNKCYALEVFGSCVDILQDDLNALAQPLSHEDI